MRAALLVLLPLVAGCVGPASCVDEAHASALWETARRQLDAFPQARGVIHMNGTWDDKPLSVVIAYDTLAGSASIATDTLDARLSGQLWSERRDGLGTHGHDWSDGPFGFVHHHLDGVPAWSLTGVDPATMDAGCVTLQGIEVVDFRMDSLARQEAVAIETAGLERVVLREMRGPGYDLVAWFTYPGTPDAVETHHRRVPADMTLTRNETRSIEGGTISEVTLGPGPAVARRELGIRLDGRDAQGLPYERRIALEPGAVVVVLEHGNATVHWSDVDQDGRLGPGDRFSVQLPPETTWHVLDTWAGAPVRFMEIV